MQKESVTISCGAAAPPPIGCGVFGVVCLVWCVCVQLVVAHNIAKCIGFPYGLLAVTEKPDAPAPRDKTR